MLGEKNGRDLGRSGTHGIVTRRHAPSDSAATFHNRLRLCFTSGFTSLEPTCVGARTFPGSRSEKTSITSTAPTAALRPALRLRRRPCRPARHAAADVLCDESNPVGNPTFGSDLSPKTRVSHCTHRHPALRHRTRHPARRCRQRLCRRLATRRRPIRMPPRLPHPAAATAATPPAAPPLSAASATALPLVVSPALSAPAAPPRPAAAASLT